MRHAIAGVVFIMVAIAAAADTTYKGYEMPPFAVVETRSGYEIRDYGPHVLATVTVQGDARSSASRGFRVLAGYIFGGNASGEKIAMTVPVSQEPRDGGYAISFMMPGRHDLNTLPKPKSGAIAFRRTAPERLAVRRFSGYANGAMLDRRAAELRDLLRRDGVTILEGPRFAYYDDPFTLPWRRRNEVAFVVKR